ncbi:MAG: transketolase [Candidatus Schekmanbacteria bacterium]|nr:transketolase [Candidatus Schekmanbacteria bacterium]
MPLPTDIDQLSITTIRTLCIDAVQHASSGHPGAPMGMAAVAYAIWDRFLRYDPHDPLWPNRDRFVLSMGHASTLLYSLLHLTGVRAVNAHGEVIAAESVSLADLKRFRQLGSRCPGHPECQLTAGVETTSGPLGQGVANSVGMAIASKWLGARYNRPDLELIGYNVFALAGDGCMMEGVSSEAASLAGHLGLDNLCWIYDSNRITIEGSTALAFSEDVATRFEAYGWTVTRVVDANDLDLISRALATFPSPTGRPTLIIVDSQIGFGSPNKMNTHSAHGEPLGEAEARLTKRAYGWPEDAQFLVPEEVRAHFAAGFARRGADLSAQWKRLFARYAAAYPELAGELAHLQRGTVPEGWDRDLPAFPPDTKGMAGRDASGKVLNAIAKNIPWLVGGAADLAPSTKTRLTFAGAGDLSAREPGGRNFHFGVREHAMGAILNGLALCKLRPFGSGFLVFSDYARPTLRLSALMELPVIHIYTHDSIGVGEDGPTHQPVEHLASLRAIPGLRVFRPADANEVVEAWRAIIPMRHAPAALVLSRQPVPTLDRSRHAPASGAARGAYVLAAESQTPPRVMLLGTGSEVSLCVAAHERLEAEGIPCRVVSMPCWEIFAEQDEDYRDFVLPPAVTARLAVEQAVAFGWERYTGLAGRVIAMSGYGASAPFTDLLATFGFTVDAVVVAARAML